MYNPKYHKSKKMLKLGNYIYGNKIRILLIDCDHLIYLKKYKNVKNLVNKSLKDKRLYYLIYALIKHRVTTILWKII